MYLRWAVYWSQSSFRGNDREKGCKVWTPWVYILQDKAVSTNHKATITPLLLAVYPFSIYNRNVEMWLSFFWDILKLPPELYLKDSKNKNPNDNDCFIKCKVLIYKI